jgi:hypothetical protein
MLRWLQEAQRELSLEFNNAWGHAKETLIEFGLLGAFNQTA